MLNTVARIDPGTGNVVPLFVSSNGWDAIGAKAFGFASFWINRTGAPVDRHGPAPDRVLTTLGDLPPLLA